MAIWVVVSRGQFDKPFENWYVVEAANKQEALHYIIDKGSHQEKFATSYEAHHCFYGVMNPPPEGEVIDER